MSVFWSAADDRVELVAYRFAPPLHAWFCQRILHNGPWDCSSVYFQSAHYWAAARHFLVSPQKLELFWQFFLAVVLNLPRTTSVDVVWRRMFSALLVALSCNLCRACQRRSVSGKKSGLTLPRVFDDLQKTPACHIFFPSVELEHGPTAGTVRIYMWRCYRIYLFCLWRHRMLRCECLKLRIVKSSSRRTQRWEICGTLLVVFPFFVSFRLHWRLVSVGFFISITLRFIPASGMPPPFF